MNFIKSALRRTDREILYLLPSVIWIIALTFLNYFCASHIINSDMSAELVLANELAKTNRIFTRQWCYSTEVRILYTQIVSLVFFKLFNSWRLVRTLTNLVFFIAVLWSYIFAMKPLGLLKKNVYLSSMFLFIPYSLEYLGIVHIGNSYMPHFIVVFVGTGLFIRLLERKDPKIMAAYILISFYSGLCGLRYMMIYSIPVLLAAVLKVVCDNRETGESVFSFSILKNRKIYVAAAGFVMAVVGQIIYAGVIKRMVTVAQNNDLLIAILDDAGVIGRADMIITGWLRSFGYYDFSVVPTLKGIASLAAVVITAALIIIVFVVTRNYRRLGNPARMMLLVFFTSFLSNTCLFLFVSGTYVTRYYIPVFILLTPCIAIFLNGSYMQWDFYRLVYVFLFIALNISGISACAECIGHDQNAPFKEVVEYLEENNLSFGLTTFWNTGVVNELSDGRVECVTVKDTDPAQIYPWLTFKKYMKQDMWKALRTEKIFFLLDDDVYQTFEEDEMIKEGEVWYNGNGYTILVYDREKFVADYSWQYCIE